MFGIYGACHSEDLANTAVFDIDDRSSVIIVTIPKIKTCKKHIFIIVYV